MNAMVQFKVSVRVDLVYLKVVIGGVCILKETSNYFECELRVTLGFSDESKYTLIHWYT